MKNKSIKIEPGDGFIPEKPVFVAETDPAETIIIPESFKLDRPDPASIYDERSLTVPELAERLNKSVTVIRRYIADGRFPNAYKDGPYKSSKIRVPKRDVDNYIKTVLISNPAAKNPD